jgi:hypothetical protein
MQFPLELISKTIDVTLLSLVKENNMNKCFKCQQETAKSGEVYYRFNKLDENGSPTGFDGFTDENSRNIFCCQNC